MSWPCVKAVGLMMVRIRCEWVGLVWWVILPPVQMGGLQ